MKKVIFILCILCFLIISVLIFKNSLSDEILVNEKNLTNNDIYYFNEPVTVECKGCLINGKKFNKKNISNNGIYEISKKDYKITIDLNKDRKFKIYDYYNNEIHNYDSNQLAFKIKSANDVLVNGNKYDNERLYNYGTYKIETNGIESKININKNDYNNKHNIYLTAGTLSSLYSSLLMSKDENYKNSFVWCGRDTFSEDYLKKLGIHISKYSGSTSDLDGLIEEVKKYIYDTIIEDKNAYFNIYTNEVDYPFIIKTFMKLGINPDRFKINTLTDGTISYSFDYSYFNKNSYKYYEKLERELLEEINNIYIDKNISEEKLQDKEYIIPFIVNNNVTYYLQYPKYLKSNDKDVNNKLKKINYVDKSVTNLYESLNDNEKEIFLKIINFDKKEFDEKYFNNDKKPYLIITGNTPMDYGFGDKNFKKTIKYINNKYSDKYNILFKPHPRAIPNDEYIKFFENLNISVLPGQMPMEAISFIYDVKLGGFPSSLYMSSESEDVLFFFAQSKKDMFHPLPEMLEKELKKVEIINPREVD